MLTILQNKQYNKLKMKKKKTKGEKANAKTNKSEP